MEVSRGAAPCFPFVQPVPSPSARLVGYGWMKEHGHIQIRSIPFHQYRGYRLLRPHPPLKRSPFPRGEGYICGSCLSVTVPSTHSSHRPHLAVQSPHSTTFHCAADAALFQVVPAERSSFQKQVLSAGAGAQPQYPPFQDQLPYFSKTPFP